jgi:hypothetical protein
LKCRAIILTYVSNWDGQLPRRFLNKERAPEPQGWLVARRYPDEASALRAFELTRDLILHEEVDASVLRFILDGISHVALMGEVPLSPDHTARIGAILEPRSEPTELPEEITERLRARRERFRGTGLDYLERRTRPDFGGPV